jgi:hypothetical protein
MKYLLSMGLVWIRYQRVLNPIYYTIIGIVFYLNDWTIMLMAWTVYLLIYVIISLNSKSL